MKKLFIITLMLIAQYSTAAANAPVISIQFEDEAVFCNPYIIDKFNKVLAQKLTADNKFIVDDTQTADYIVNCEILGIGRGKIINDIVAASFAISGSASSMFVTPIIGPVVQAAGVTITAKRVFGMAVRVNLIRCNDKKIVYKRTFLGRTAIKKSDKLSNEIFDFAIDSTTYLIAKNLLNRNLQYK